MRGTGKGTIDFVNARVIRGGLRNGAARGEGEAKHYGPSPFLLRLSEREGERKKEEARKELAGSTCCVKKNEEGEGQPCADVINFTFNCRS